MMGARRHWSKIWAGWLAGRVAPQFSVLSPKFKILLDEMFVLRAGKLYESKITY